MTLIKKFSAIALVCLLLFSACSTPLAPSTATLEPTATPSPAVTLTPTPTLTPAPSPTPLPPTATPDPPRANTPDLSALGEGWAAFSYTLQTGEDLGIVASRYGLSYDVIRRANGFSGGETFFPGQAILVPQKISRPGPAFKMIPDSELVYGPSAIGFDPYSFIAQYPLGYLYHYTEIVDGGSVSGAALIQRAAENYSLNPRLLLALLEYQSGWLTRADPQEKIYPYGRAQGGAEGLFRQLQWAANALNRGFYEWRDGSLSLLILGDGTRVGLDEGLNAATASVQYVLSETRRADDWEEAVRSGGLAATYAALFGNPFAHTVEPLLPPGLSQPELALPWPGGETWFYSGGPHPSFGSGTPWGAVDFLPPGKESGCRVSENWVTAAAAGVVARSGDGQLLLDLDGDGFEQTGWVILYLHIAAQDRPPSGTYLARGDHVGHPSCEGGFAQDAHVHIARKYNGVWLAASGEGSVAPFAMGDYTVHSTGQVYNGTLSFGKFFKAACACRDASNAVTK